MTAQEPPTYFDGWQHRSWTCPGCSWHGDGTRLAREQFSELFELHCPTCDHRLAVISHPSRAETEMAAKAGNAEAIAHLESMTAVDVLRAEHGRSRRGRGRLPELDGSSLTFTFHLEGGTDGMNPEWLVLTCDGTEVHRERSGFEHWEAIVEVSRKVLARYPGRVLWIDPAKAGDCLGGDDLGYDTTIMDFLEENAISPPTGGWARRDGQ